MNNILLQRPPNGTNKFHIQNGMPPPRPSNMSASVFDLNRVGHQGHHQHNSAAMPNVITTFLPIGQRTTS